MSTKKHLSAWQRCAVAIILFSGSFLAKAAVVWDQSPDAVGGALIGAWSNISNSQNFTDVVSFASDENVTGMDIYVHPDYPALGDLVRIRIYTGAPDGTLFEFVEQITAIDSSGATSFTPDTVRAHVDFTSAVSFLAGVQYWIGMSGEANELSLFGLSGATGPLLDGGMPIYVGAGFLGVNPGVGDMAFRLYNGVNAVPEPETYAMMLAGLGLLGFVSRGRRKQRAV